MPWSFEPGPVAGLFCLSVAYALAATVFRQRLLSWGGPAPKWMPPGAMSAERPGALSPGQVLLFYTGVLLAALAILSPLHALGEHYLLSAHMVQHLVLVQVVAPLLLLGTPGWMLRPLLRRGPIKRLAGTLLTPVPGFLVFNLVFAAWHVPAIYDLSLHVPLLHAVEHGLFLGLALATWWPVLGPAAEFPRLPYGAQVIYLFFESLPPTVVGAIISLAERPIYPTYWAAERIYGIPGFGTLSPLEDQQLGGLIMWLPGALGYFLVLSVIFFLWLERRSPNESPPYRSINPDRPRTAPQVRRA
jgi:putative membrane protein